MVMLMSRLFDGIIITGRLTVIRANRRTETFGDGTGPTVTIRFTSPQAERKAMLRWRVGMGEAYMNGGMVIEHGAGVAPKPTCCID